MGQHAAEHATDSGNKLEQRAARFAAGASLIFGAALLFTGCAALSFNRASKAEGERDGAKSAVLREAQVSAHETVEALQAAPASRPVDVAARSAGETADLLDQANGPLMAPETAALRSRVAGLLSENATIRAAAERELRARSEDIAEKSRQLAEAETKLAAAVADREAAFAREHALANEYRKAKVWGWVKWAGMGLGSAALLILRLYMGNMPAALGKSLAFLDAKLPENVMAQVRSEIDAHLTPGGQTLVRKWLLRTNATDSNAG